jgi:CMP/dCMP kinase
VIIAVDGPTASGKGTIARALAVHYDLPHLDTGLLYRAVGRQVARNLGDPDNPADALAACAFPDDLLADPDLRSEAAVCLSIRRYAKRFLPASAPSRPSRAARCWMAAISAR